MARSPGRGSAGDRVAAPAGVDGRRPTLGVLAGWSVFDAESLNPFLGAVLEGFSIAAAEHDCNLLIAAGSEHPSNDARIQAAWPFRHGGHQLAPVGHFDTDALMVVQPVRTEPARRYLTDLRATGFPVTFLGMEPEAPYVAIDNRAGIFAAFRHLVAHGHERIAFIAGEPADRGDTPRRLQAFREAATEAGLAIDERLVDYGMHNRSGGRAATARILGRGAPFTALMASNDQSAMGAADVLVREGLRVPDDVAVVGFDDQPGAAAHVPSLTSVAYPLRAAAHALLELTLRRVRAPGAACERITIDPTLVTRLSCGCVPGAGADDASAADRARGPRSLDRIAVDVLRRLRADGDGAWHGEEPEGALRATIGAFLQILATGEERQAFGASLAPILHYVERVDADANGCQVIVTELRNEMIARLGEAGDDRRQWAEDRLHEARLVFSEAAHRRDHRHRVEADLLSNVVGRATTQILASTTEEQIQAALCENLGDIGVREASLLTMADGSAEPAAGLDGIAAAARHAFPGFGESLRRRSDRYHLALVPIMFGGEQLGCALFDATRMGQLGTIARQLGAGLHSARLHAEVIRLSLTDQLTGLRNRAYLDQALAEEIERSVRYARPMSVLMFDIDRFKSYNDTHGHLAGDAALVAVARAARSVARDADVLARYGGEEFVMVLTDTDLDGGYRLAERILQAVRELGEMRSQLTVSIGVASVSSWTSNETAHALLERADQALYQAKRTGRDRVCVTGAAASRRPA